MPHVSIKPEALFELFGLTITNSLLTTAIVTLLFIGLMLYYRSQVGKKKAQRSLFFYALNSVLQQLYGLFESVTGDKIKALYPLLACFFLFILLQNWFGLLPGVGSILVKPSLQHSNTATQQQGNNVTTEQSDTHAPEKKVVEPAGGHGAEVVVDEAHPEEGMAKVEEVAKEEAHDEVSASGAHEVHKIPLFRGGTADLNMTLALGIIAVIAVQFFGIKFLGLKTYLGKFFNFSSPIYFFIGILELVSEFSRAFSFSFRLFGNIIAGEILLVIIATLVPVLASFPFVVMETFVGLIQAVVFATLAAIFIKMAVTAHH